MFRKSKKIKNIYWLLKDDFTGVEYDQEVKVEKTIDSVTFLISFKRWIKDQDTEKAKLVKATAIAKQVEKYENIIYLKINYSWAWV